MPTTTPASQAAAVVWTMHALGDFSGSNATAQSRNSGACRRIASSANVFANCFIKSNGCRTILVEKTDRLYRNIRDWVTVDDLDIEVHFVKEGVILSDDSRSSEKFMHGIKVLMAKNYIDNLGEEVHKGMLEKAKQGHWPSFATADGTNPRVNLVAERLISARLSTRFARKRRRDHGD